MARFNELKPTATSVELVQAVTDLTPRLARRVGSMLGIKTRKKRSIIQQVGEYKGAEQKKAVAAYNYIVALRGVKVAKFKKIFIKVAGWVSDQDWKQVKSAKDAFKLATKELDRFKDE